MSRGLLCLVMIVKNEAKSIRRTLESCRHVADCWLILDTGSTDGTQDVIRDAIGNMPGRLVSEPFEDFSATRNRALELAEDLAVFQLMLSGDEVLKDASGLRSWLADRVNGEADAFGARYRFGEQFEGKSDRITRSGGLYRYHGVTHEVLCHPEGVKPPETAPALVHYDPQETEDKRERWRLDMTLLRREAHERPTARTLFYLAQTYACLGLLEAAHWVYTARANEEQGFQEERYEAAFRAAHCAALTGWHWGYVKERYLFAHSLAPHRAEPLVEIAEHAINCARPDEGLQAAELAASLPEPTWCRMFYDRRAYQWRAPLALACCYMQLNRHREAAPLLERAMASELLPKAERVRLCRYLEVCRDLAA